MRSPCVHLRSSERRMPGSTASIITIGSWMLAGKHGLGGQKPTESTSSASSWQKSARVSSSAGLCRPACTQREAAANGGPGEIESRPTSTKSSTSQPFSLPHGCGPMYRTLSSSEAPGSSSPSCECGESGQHQCPLELLPIGHSATTLAGLTPAQNRARLMGKPGRPETSSRKRTGTWRSLALPTSTWFSASYRTEGGRHPCSQSHCLSPDTWLSSLLSSLAGNRSSSPRKRTTA
mmetsp:Transcript_38375/g.113947  ORF Transcript_38375/g.113947 Transcript_38375/m.113947 type:complete len:235 (-) Transcript_38375:718-1422(-)